MLYVIFFNVVQLEKITALREGEREEGEERRKRGGDRERDGESERARENRDIVRENISKGEILKSKNIYTYINEVNKKRKRSWK